MSFNMYTCPKCRKIFKINGSEKKAKCPKCTDAILVDTGISEVVWKSYDAKKKKDIISVLMDENPISIVETKPVETPITASEKLEDGIIINNTYKVMRPIGEGGSGEVFLAWHLNLEKDVVIKRIKDDFVGRMNERGEADILKKLHHRYLPQVYDFIQMDNEIYTVIDYIDGNTLKDYIDAKVRFNEQQLIKWLKQLCEALDYLHTQTPAIIHSDIKPSNIMVGTSGDICLIDFNISFDEDDIKKISGYTAAYASPEQILKAQTYSKGGNYQEIRLDAKSDIFSLGASIYHIMTMQNPLDVFKNGKPLWDVNLPMPYSKALADIIEKSLQRDPKDRYQTASLMLTDIETIKLRDARYKKLKKVQFACNLICSLMIVIGAFMIIKGAGLIKLEDFDAEYERIVAASERDDYDLASSEALDLINNPRYSSIEKKRNKERADLYYIIANSCFENEEYQEAIPFYEDTIRTDKSNPDYYRDYAISYARTGDIDSAERIAQDGIAVGLKDADLYLVNAEIMAAKKDWDNALLEYEKVTSTSDNEKTLGRAYILMSRAYRANGDLDSAKRVLSDALSTVNDTWRLRLLREKGAVIIQFLEQNGNDTQWLDEAGECYKNLTNSGRGTLNDYLNYSLILRMTEQDAEALSVLEEAQSIYPDEYRIPARLAMYEIQDQNKLEDGQRDYSKVKEYYDGAVELYEKYKRAGDSDDEMQQLDGLIEDLRSKGWL